jgi:hypothetical protein
MQGSFQYNLESNRHELYMRVEIFELVICVAIDDLGIAEAIGIGVVNGAA